MSSRTREGAEVGTRRLVLLGSTGSIGTQALEVVERLAADGLAPQVAGLAAGGGRLPLLAEQAVRLGVPALAVASLSLIHI